MEMYKIDKNHMNMQKKNVFKIKGNVIKLWQNWKVKKNTKEIENQNKINIWRWEESIRICI